LAVLLAWRPRVAPSRRATTMLMDHTNEGRMLEGGLRPVPTARMARHSGTRHETSGSIFGLVTVLVVMADLGVFAFGFLRDDLSVFSLGAVAASLPIVAIVIMRFSVRRPAYDVASIMWCGFFLRLFGAYFRMIGAADALLYHNYGRRQADLFRAFEFRVITDRAIPGTGGLDVLSGVAHAIVFDDFYGSFVVFTVISFIGSCLFLRAFQIAFPAGDEKRYALLVFLLPSLVYWPSSLGKEAWIMLGLGLCALGAARLYTRETFRGAGLIAVGLGAISLIRPHVALLAAGATTVGALVSGREPSDVESSTGRRGMLGQDKVEMARLHRLVSSPVVRGISVTSRVAAVLLLVVGASWLAKYTADVLKVESLGSEDARVALDYVEEQTSQGGSQFVAARVSSPLDYPWAAVTVLLRPFPGEARDLPGLLASSETMFLLGLVAFSWRRLRQLARLWWRSNYVAFAAAFVVMFVFAFSTIGNFGLLARQRTQVLPFVFVLLSAPAVVVRPARGRGPAWRAQRRAEAGHGGAREASGSGPARRARQRAEAGEGPLVAEPPAGDSRDLHELDLRARRRVRSPERTR
ncbi:MAG: hypothetical protein N2037_08845, partial [Acidimicrobiales bacterium]|nr:hypothetical protein [Acidimicrobiales bacterium]